MEPAPTNADHSARELPALRRPLDVGRLRAAVLSASGPWRALDVVAVTGSTNSDLLARAAGGGDISGSVLVAEYQTSGRGRRGRHWRAAPGAQLLLSVGVPVDGVPADAWGWLPLTAGLAVADAVAAAGARGAQVKWPNDVLVGHRKLAGTLCEVAPRAAVVVVGIGVNVSLPGAVIDELDAVSLHEVADTPPDREAVLVDLLAGLGARSARWRRHVGADPESVADYRRRCATLGARVRIETPDGAHCVGSAQSIDSAGRLVVDVDGHQRAVTAGDVVHLRYAGETATTGDV